jgi:hypothetical protein
VTRATAEHAEVVLHAPLALLWFELAGGVELGSVRLRLLRPGSLSRVAVSRSIGRRIGLGLSRFDANLIIPTPI